MHPMLAATLRMRQLEHMTQDIPNSYWAKRPNIPANFKVLSPLRSVRRRFVVGIDVGNLFKRRYNDPNAYRMRILRALGNIFYL
jgi:hypothetical protein